MYIASIRTAFSAAHCIKGYKGNCSQLHGHNYRVEVHVASEAVNEIGLSVDFRNLKQMAHDVVAELDHQMLNDLPCFADRNPTAEHIAAYLFEQIEAKLPEHLSLHCIRLWETDDYMVEYRGKGK
jgi:6-pyruvoyltetrahydropterin/6-carboxytetrahydropterin synthase